MENTFLKTCFSGNLQSIENLLLRGFSPNMVVKAGQTILTAVCSITYEATFPEGLNTEAARYGIKDISKEISLVHMRKVINMLLAHGGKPEYCDDSGDTSFHYAANTLDLDTVKLFFHYGVDPNLINKQGRSVLHTVLSQRRQRRKDPCDIVEYLIEHGVDVNSVDFNEGLSPLHLAVIYGHFKSAELLLTMSSVNPNIQCKIGRTALMLTARYLLECNVRRSGQGKLIELLLKKNPNIELKDRDWQTVLHLAAFYKNVHVWNKCVSHMVTLNQEVFRAISIGNIKGDSPLHLCFHEVLFSESYFFHKGIASVLDIMEAVIKSGALLSVLNKNDCSPICHWLERMGFPTMGFPRMPCGRNLFERCVWVFLSAGLNIYSIPAKTWRKIVDTLKDWDSYDEYNPFNQLLYVIYGVDAIGKCFSRKCKRYRKESVKKVRTLQHIASQVVRINLFPNAMVSVKTLEIPSLLEDLIVPPDPSRTTQTDTCKTEK